MGGNPVLKKKSISKVLQITTKYDLVDNWRVRNPLSTTFINLYPLFTFRKNHFSGFIKRRLEHFYFQFSSKVCRKYRFFTFILQKNFLIQTLGKTSGNLTAIIYTLNSMC